MSVLLLSAIALRLVYLLHYRVDSDESQHLHVIWGWSQGLIPYRDFFDNHTPLFHILCIPAFRFFGERPDIIVWMRLLVFPLYLLTLAFTYWIGCAVTNRRAAGWAVLTAALTPFMFLGTLEFRTDDLWILLWVMTIAVLVMKPPNMVRMLLAGLLLGTAVAVSMKTVLLLMVLAGAAGSMLFFLRGEDQSPPIRVLAGWGAAMVAGFLIVPCALVAFFATQHALPQLAHCVIGHNAVPGAKRDYLRMLFFPLLAWFWIRSMRRTCRRNPGNAAAQVVVTSANWLYMAILLGFWPVLSNEDFPLWVPFFSIQAAGWLFPVSGEGKADTAGIAARIRRSPRFACLFAVALLMACLAFCQLPWKNHLRDHVDMVRAALRLTGPDDWVADNKGETIFRKRSTYHVLEKMTKMRFRMGLLEDDIADRIIATKTCVALPSTNFPRQARAFLQGNFISVGPLSVAGQVLSWSSNASSAPIEFDVAVPARYAVVGESGFVDGVLDGTPFNESRPLSVGHHVFHAQHPTGPVVLVWANAVDCGYSPFPLHGP